jgi:hypothetical protein
MYLPKKNPLTLLPGATRDLDQVHETSTLAIRFYDRKSDKSIPLEERQYCPATLMVSVEGAPEQEYRRSHPCYFSSKTDIKEACAELGLICHEDDPVPNDEDLSTAMISGVLAVGDGSVYQTKTYSTASVATRALPVRLSPELLQRMLMLEAGVESVERSDFPRDR